MQIPAEKKAAYDKLAIENFREYVRIPSVHPNVDYGACIKFVQAQAASLNLPCKVIAPKPNKPIAIITWEGSDPKLPSILLNGHMDVVPVNEEKWTHPPFGAVMDESGKIFGRGTQDMKCISIQYLETIRRLKESGVVLRRTLHCSFVPDEEIGGVEGMKELVQTEEFKQMNVGFALDEGICTPDEVYNFFYGEKCMWDIKFHCPGQPGHGCILHEDTAGEKARVIMDRIFDFREVQKKTLKNNPKFTFADVITINATIFEGGVQANVLPAEVTITVDCRMPVTTNLKEWEDTLERWCKEAGKGVWIEKVYADPITPPTKLDDSNPYWLAFKATFEKLGLEICPKICPGVTDNRYLRQLGIPAFGLSLINKTPILMHDNDEYLGSETFLKAIDIYTDLIPALANV